MTPVTANAPENPWKLALEGTGAGIWDWNLLTGEQSHSPRWEELIGYQGGELTRGYFEFISRVHPDDIAALDTAIADCLDGHAPAYTAELRMRCKDGSWKWLASKGMIVSRDAQGAPTRMIGTHIDITQRKQAEQLLIDLNTELQERTRLQQTTLNHISQGILVFDAARHIIEFNPRACELLDIPQDFLAGRPTLMQLSRLQNDRGDFGPGAMLVSGNARPFVVAHGVGEPPLNYLRETPQGRMLEVTSQLLPDGGMVRTFADITEHVKAKAALHDSEERWKLALESTGDGVWDWHIPSGQEFFSKNLLQMYGLGEADISNYASELDERTHPDDLVGLNQNRQAHFDGLTPTYVSEHRIRCVDGSWKWVMSRGMVIIRDKQGLPVRMIGTHTDITARKEAEALIWQQAHFDSLTGLPNRRMMRDRLGQALKKCRRDDSQLALLFIDLDRFKEVNDTLGHDRGDVLLAEAARRIGACVRAVDTVARMGGDEFTVIVTELQTAQDLESVLQKLLATLSAVFQLDHEQVFVSASIGVTLFPLDGSEIEDLLKNADQALYVAKGAGRNRYSFFTPALQQAAKLRAQLTHDLRVALADHQFRLVYQPIVELATGIIHKAEALVRWQHPVLGLISPAEFIPVAESSGLIVALGEWVFQQAADQVKAWRAALHPSFQISVNRSPVQFENPNPQHQPWIAQLAARGLSGDCVAVEITEGLLLSTSEGVVEQLLGLRDDGIQVSLDDFGTGYSSLSYLQKFDIDFVKIDQSFVRGLLSGSTDLALCQAIIAMAHALGMKVIAEGVETLLQRDLLALAGCDFAQGYWFSRPVPAADFEAQYDSVSKSACPADCSI